MIDLKKYLNDKNDINFVEELYQCVECQNEIDLRYKEVLVFTFCPSGKSVYIYDDNSNVPKKFESIDDMLLNYLLDGKPFIEQVEFIDFA